MAPDVREMLVSGPLANVSIAYRNKKYIADRVFPLIDNVDPKAKITRHLKGAWFRDEADVRAAGTRAKRGSFPADYLDINTKEYAFAKEVTDEDRRNAKRQLAPPLKPDQDAIEFAADKIDLKKEVRTAALIKETVWSGIAAGGEDAEGLWAPVGATNTFFDDVSDKIELIRAATGMRPNTLALDAGTYGKLKKVEELIDKIKYTQRGVLTAELIAAMLDLDEVLIGEAIKSTAKETKAGTEFASTNVWELTAGKGMAFLFYRPSSPGLKIPSAGYQARSWYIEQGNTARKTTVWREPAEHQDVYECAEETDIVATGADMGYMWKDTLLT
jgi:hypothetical protein